MFTTYKYRVASHNYIDIVHYRISIAYTQRATCVLCYLCELMSHLLMDPRKYCTYPAFV